MKKVSIALTIFLLSIIAGTTCKASYTTNGIDSFPESYRPYLEELKKRYPNWEFTALYTELDWNLVIEKECEYGKNLVPKNYSDAWKNTSEGIYDVEVDSGWVNASKRAVEYTMDPRNFLNEIRMFQFEKLTYDEKNNTLEGVEKILYGTEFYKRNVTYKNEDGNPINTNENYGNLILEAAIYSGVSPYHLAARIKQEVGPFLSHPSISGTVEGYEGLYNFYNIGATSSTEDLGAIKNGLKYARDANGASEEKKANLLIPWKSPKLAIKGGGVFIGSSYILVGQNTLYLQKYDVNDARGGELFWHQYMTNCLAPYSESYGIYKAYSSMGLLNSSIGFLIPVYENMPEIPVSNPNINLNEFQSDNTLVYADVETTLSLRTGPSTSYEIITSIPAKEQFTRIEKGIQAGEAWDKVILKNGMIGYVFQYYVKEVEETTVEPEEPEVPEPSEPSEPEESPEEQEPPEEPEESGEISDGTDLSFKEPLIVNGNKVTGIDMQKLTVKDIKECIETELKFDIYKDDKLLEENEQVGTNCQIIFENDENEILYKYIIIIYGDVTGEGEINSLDLYAIQRHILEVEVLQKNFLIAGNTTKDGSLPNALDIYAIQRHILEIEEIVQ